MYKYEGYDSFITAYPQDFPSLQYVPGLRIEIVPKITGNWLQDSCSWLRENAPRINVLNVYHLGESTYQYAKIYKHYNPNGKLYIKLDGTPMPARFRLWLNIKPLMSLFRSDFVSTEFQENVKILSRKWFHKIGAVQNPINPNELRDYRPFSQRSNTIFTAGRLGTKQKATEILLEAFVKIADQIPDWTLKLAGGFYENVSIADDFYKAHPELRERVIFTGNIIDRDEMTELYRDAKIFAFPTRAEGCPLALSEALMHGLFAVISNIPPNKYMTENFRYALSSEVYDIDGMAKNLLYACTHEAEIESIARQGRDHILERCSLERISHIIAEGLA